MPSMPFQQKRAAFKLVSKDPMRWRDVRSGELLTRSEYEKRKTAYDNEQALKQQRLSAYNSALSGDAPVPQRQPATAEPNVREASAPEGVPSTARVTAPPPPMPSLGGIAIDAADVLTDNPDTPSKPGICESLSLGASVALSGLVAFLVPEQAEYLIPPPIELSDVLRPLGRIADRHMPIIVSMNEDGRDLSEALGAAASLGAHMARAYADARKQDRMEREHEQREWRKQRGRSGANGGGGDDSQTAGESAPPWAAFADHLQGAASVSNGGYAPGDGPGAGAAVGSQDRGTARSAASAVAGLLSADALGRQRLGLN